MKVIKMRKTNICCQLMAAKRGNGVLGGNFAVKLG